MKTLTQLAILLCINQITTANDYIVITNSDIEATCGGFHDTLVFDEIIGTSPSEIAVVWLRKILETNGIQSETVSFYEAPVSNARAKVSPTGEREIYYDEVWLLDQMENDSEENRNWAALGLLAHEAAHIHYTHIITGDKKKRKENELIADEWSGWALYHLNANLEQAYLWLDLGNEEGETEGYPAKNVRKAYIRKGWLRAKSTPNSITSNFTPSSLLGVAPLQVTFDNTSEGEVTLWSWNFGNGETSTEKNPSYTFKNPGDYVVTLKVANNTSSDISQRKISILEKIKPDFTAIPREGTAPLSVKFTNTSSGKIDKVNWNFGDGTISDEFNPIHRYENPGLYEIRLVASGQAGSEFEYKSNYIIVSEVPDEEPSCEIDDIKITHNIQIRDPNAGFLAPAMRILLEGILTGVKGKKIEIIATFDYLTQYGFIEPLVANPLETRFKDSLGNVAVKSGVIRLNENDYDFSESIFKNRLELPYYALNIIRGAGYRNKLYTKIHVYIDSNHAYTSDVKEWILYN
ncbi:PKD domain-containing protein [Synoicihabitans lomoniglobus]|uniref:PKD domain-containing protein n=1 Tax=Synoicihabitans lomoniglobus TaxID=2909285 RepID=A0AAE9ZY77_9BACT|nr:PKD domain-containing protein [Opitutaceae bacterium LMO-M01]WED63358.1 PKD domain-containing protein [Opitutaceae bacterium LMO-M01]